MVYSEKLNAVRARKHRRENYERLQTSKMDIVKCDMCQLAVLPTEIVGFDFDHIDPSKKHKSISYMVECNYSWQNTILPEIAKCRLLCVICHVIHTKNQKKDEVKIVCRKRKHYVLPRNRNNKESEICENGFKKRPTKEELFELVKGYSFVDVGKMYGVCYTTIIKWCKKEGIPHKRRKLMEESE